MFNQMTNLECKTNHFAIDNINCSELSDNNNINDNNNDEIDYNNIVVSNNISDETNVLNTKELIMYNNIQIKKFIDEFTEDQQIEIFKIIKYYDEYYSSNNNGIFINLDNISNNCKKEIITFINFSKQNNECLQEMEYNIDKYKQLVNDSTNENN
jgi:hypothetical protein